MSQTTEQLYQSDIGDILENSLNGKRPGPEECLRLLKSDDVSLIGLVASHLTKKQFGNKASFVNNIILCKNFELAVWGQKGNKEVRRKKISSPFGFFLQLSIFFYFDINNLLFAYNSI